MSCCWFQQNCRQVLRDDHTLGEPESILKDFGNLVEDGSNMLPKTSFSKLKLASGTQQDGEMGRAVEVKTCLPPISQPKGEGSAIHPAVEVNQAVEPERFARAQVTRQQDEKGCLESRAEHLMRMKITKDAGRSLKVQRQAAQHLKKSSSRCKSEMGLLAEGSEVLRVIDVGAQDHLQSAQGFEEKDIILAVTKVGMIDTSRIRATPDQMIEWMRAAADFECVILRQQNCNN
eukprot:TRINITY_DN87440_c0_g1_i1.p1 TRINITY_DN87440_c0_g1~~TRINITY_DN87440_c0_g1_i1.p1  ORF type:complete len:232 (-),score=52.17 TRINITY_DN87440_c0_g1_i1:358-1053(-)